MIYVHAAAVADFPSRRHVFAHDVRRMHRHYAADDFAAADIATPLHFRHYFALPIRFERVADATPR